jgi:metal-responsive CopG/Arc/MetJ family transcriptional regulator
MVKKTSSKTEQLNIRMPKELLEDIDEISKILRVNKSEWIKIKLSEIVFEEKNRLKRK